MGLKLSSTTQAIGYSLLWTVGVPVVGTCLLWYVLAPVYGTGMVVWVPWSVDIIPSILSIAYSLQLAAWAQSRLRTRFRELAAAT
jgi:hypothetical protein